MKMILLETVPTLGDVGQLINVKSGYARNYLIPRKLACIANERRVAEFNNLKKRAEAKVTLVKKGSEEVRKRLEELSINFQKKVGKNDRLFGSVTNMDIGKALKEKGFDINRRQIELSDPIRKPRW